MHSRDEKAAEKGRVLFADRTLRQLRDEDLSGIHHLAEVDLVLALRNHVANELRPQKRVKSRKDRAVRIAAQERKLLSPVVDDFLVLHRFEKLRAECRVDEELPEIGQGAAASRLKEGLDRVRENRVHLVAPG